MEQELALIEKHQDGFVLSPVMNLGKKPDLIEGLKEDYTQYIPRGHYTKEELKRYFKSMMWYGRLTFRLKDQDETRSAFLITMALQDKNNQNSWEKIYQPTNFMVGKSDDIGYRQLEALITEVYGAKPVLTQIAADDKRWQEFTKKTAALEPPAINSIPIWDETVQPDREREIKGFRFMGQRFTIDASIFQRLVYREAQKNDQNKRRNLPKGLDIPAALGSQEAYNILTSMGETRYQNYPENMAKLRSYLNGLSLSTWTQNLYWSWMYTLLPLTSKKGEGYPSFMQNQAWERKELVSFLGSWTELKHDTILYAKQVYAEMGGLMEEVDERGYVEPNLEVYARLAALTALTREGLETRGLLTDRDKERLQRMEELALSLKTISDKELKEQSLTQEEYDLISSFGGQLEHFWLETLRDDGIDSTSLWENPAPVITDVATNPNDALVLEEGTGFINEIYAVVPIDGKLRIAKGGVYSYHEFAWPANDRLTDKKWQEMLRSGQASPPPAWTKAFMSDGSVTHIPPWERSLKRQQ